MTYFKYRKCYLGCIIRSVMLNKLGNYAALLSSTSVHFKVLFSVPVTPQKKWWKKRSKIGAVFLRNNLIKFGKKSQVEEFEKQ